MGDLIETIPAIVDLKQEDSNSHVTLMAAKPFIDLADDIPILDDIIPVDLRDFMVLEPGRNLLDRYRTIDRFSKQLKTASYDVVLNFTHTKTSAALCHILGVSDTRGVTLDQRGFQLVSDPWLFYFFVSNLNRPFNQFNLVDIYRRSVGGGRSPGQFTLSPGPDGEKEAQDLWNKQQIPHDRPVIGLAVGASNHTKRWLPDHFAHLARLLKETQDAHIIILGSAGDKEIAQEIIQENQEFITDLTAKTTLKGLASVVRRCNLVVSNDTGTMHVAAAVGTPTISLVMGTALASETAPYHSHGLVIQSLHDCAPCGYTNLCKDAKCRLDITPEAVAQCVEILLSSSGETDEEIPDSPDLGKVQVFRGHFDEDGLFDLYPLIKRHIDPHCLFDRILRRIWMEFLENPPWEILDNGGIGRWIDRVVDYCTKHFDLSRIAEMLQQYHNKDQPQLLKPLQWLDQGIQVAAELSHAASSQPLNIKNITSLGEQLAQIDRQLESVGHAHQLLRAFHIYFNLRKGSLSTADLKGQADETRDIYRGYKLQLLLADRMIEGVLTKLSNSPQSQKPLASSIPAVKDIESYNNNKESIDWNIPSDSRGWEQIRRDLIASMNLKIPIPETISSHKIGDQELIIAPDKAAWIVTDPLGIKALHLLKDGKTLGQCMVDLIENEDVSIDRSVDCVKALVAEITKQGFRSDTPTIKTTLEDNPPNLQLFLTHRCNLQCTHCYASAGNPLDGEISTSDWIEVIDQFTTMNVGNVVTLSGGEPLVHPEFDKIARHAKNTGCKVYLLTNGVSVTSLDRARSLTATLDSVQLSLEGTVEDIHDAIRGKGSFQRAITGLDFLLTAGMPVELVFVVLPGNVADLRDNLGDFVARFQNPNLSVALGVVNFIGRAQGIMNDPPESLVGQVVDAYPDAPWLRKGNWVSNRIVEGCPLANSVVVDADGRITTCPYLHYHSPYRVGQMPLVKAVSLDSNWHADTIRQNPKCKECDLRNFPCGGCMVQRTECSNQIFQRAYYRMVFGR